MLMTVFSMSDYYRHKKGGIYRVLYEAKHTETDEILIVYQAMYGNGEIWARPKEIFFDEGRFIKITKKEAVSAISSFSKQKYRFPDIEFSTSTENLIDYSRGFSTPVKSMITLLTKRGLVDKGFFTFIKTDDELELEIINKINFYSNEKELEDIFHLIQIWGGSTGRGLYIHGDGFVWENILPQYKELVSCCLSIKEVTEDNIDKLYRTVYNFNQNVPRIGVSFITKHTRYWLCRTLGNNTLPIYDSIMANYVMQKPIADIRHLREYWNAMAVKAKDLGVGLMPMERQIFKFAFEFLKNRSY